MNQLTPVYVLYVYFRLINKTLINNLKNAKVLLGTQKLFQFHGYQNKKGIQKFVGIFFIVTKKNSSHMIKSELYKQIFYK